MVTTLKNTAKPVTEVAFPALTICSSGLHMSNVEKKIVENFDQWRLENKRKEATRNDVEDYMLEIFQIKYEVNQTEPSVSILDILKTMISPSNVDAFLAANGLRDNAIACNEESQRMESSTVRNKRDINCDLSCRNPAFSLHGPKCYYKSTVAVN